MGVFKIAIKIQDWKWLVEAAGFTHSLPDVFGLMWNDFS